jgi:RimJ/RimL family protein N-acetyltransferase
MDPTSTAGTYLLSIDHVEALERLAADPEIAAIMVVPAPEYVTRFINARHEGSAWAFAVMDQGRVVGVSSIVRLDGNDPEVGGWIAWGERGKGYATFALRMLVEFAFRNLSLPQVRASVRPGDQAERRVLEKCGFLPNGDDRYVLTPDRWREVRDGPALALLHPDLKQILQEEIAAGNQVLETGRGWPDPDSVFVRLKQPFVRRPSPLPEGITYTEPNDPHWWKADYTTRSPRHILAC